MVDLVERFCFMEGKPIRTDWLTASRGRSTLFGWRLFRAVLDDDFTALTVSFQRAFCLQWFAPLPRAIVAYYGKMWVLYQHTRCSLLYMYKWPHCIFKRHIFSSSFCVSRCFFLSSSNTWKHCRVTAAVFLSMTRWDDTVPTNDTITSNSTLA